ncbi:MAG TPA: divergent PAP2 family protein [Candidatus Nanoarchaeia archaeon]|nr:divergent PAP2 family protein [Candidatus Nanoarchaeia archaeon]
MIEELILSVTIAWLFGKILKTIIQWSKDKKISAKALLYDGGMPSLHTIATVSLSTGLFLDAGSRLSPLFVLSVVLALIVINDALKVRMLVEKHSKVINKMNQDKKDFPQMEEHSGHTPAEVLVGIIIGIIIPIIVYAIL